MKAPIRGSPADPLSAKVHAPRSAVPTIELGLDDFEAAARTSDGSVAMPAIRISRSSRLSRHFARACCALLLAGSSLLFACDYDVAEIVIDKDAASGTDPCRNGTFVCMDVLIHITGDITTPVTDAVLTAVVDGYTFEARSVNGEAEMTLPTDRALWVHFEASGYWSVDHAAFVPRGDPLYEGYVDMFSQQLLDVYLGQIDASLDETKGYLWFEFFVGDIRNSQNIPEASVAIGTTSDPPIVNVGTELVRRDSLVAGGGSYIHFINVPPGPFAPMPIAPGHDCSPISAGLPHVMSPYTNVQIAIICTPTAP